MIRITICTVSLLALGAGLWQFGSQNGASGNLEAAKPIAQDSDSFMQLKLDHSKDILEGLATEDFEKIAKSAQALSLLSLEREWKVITTPEYLAQSSDFRRSVKVITEAAKAKNVDRAALGFVDLTVRCVECHNYLRGNRGLADDVPETTGGTRRRD